MPDDALPIPLEIPWRLAATTQHLKEGFPNDTTLALFVYEPKTPQLTSDYPGERLVYLKFTVTVSPCHLDSSSLPEWASSPLVGGSPVLHVVLDVGVTPEPFETGGIRPYFHAASPIRRSMIETGVVGHEIFEGEADALAIGKSASSVYETVGSKVTTNKKGSSGGLPGIFNIDKNSVETTVDSSRSLDQYQETVERDASVERKELLSHMTNVANVITLLNAKHVGSPFLRFSLSPRPLTQLFVDPSDPNLWYKQLLQRRSSGIEGIQEFFAVVAVPRHMDFCVQALLRRICVLDDPPVPPEFPRSTLLSDAEVASLLEYLYRKYPVGTPLDQLDLDVLDQFKDTDLIPALQRWYHTQPNRGVVSGEGAYLRPELEPGFNFMFQSFRYKTTIEVRRDMLIDEYLEDLARSPLERGIVVMHSATLRTCFDMADTGPQASASESAAPPPSEVPFTPDLDYRRPREPDGPAAALDSIAAVTRWNALEAQLIEHVGRLEPDTAQLSLRSRTVVEMLLRRCSKLRPSDPRNLTLERAAVLLHLTASQVSALEAANVRDLKGLAQALLAAPAAERINGEIEAYVEQLDERARCKMELEPFKLALSSSDAERIIDHISVALASDDNGGSTQHQDASGGHKRRRGGKAR